MFYVEQTRIKRGLEAEGIYGTIQISCRRCTKRQFINSQVGINAHLAPARHGPTSVYRKVADLNKRHWRSDKLQKKQAKSIVEDLISNEKEE